MIYNNENSEVLRCPDGQFTVDVIVPKGSPIGTRHNAPAYFGEWRDIESGEIDHSMVRAVVISEWQADIVFSGDVEGLVRVAAPSSPLSD